MPVSSLPLQGLKVIEFTHMVMGPTVGQILGDLGADVIKVEPLEGDNTRRLKGSGAGYFPMYNRNKRTLAIDIKSAEGNAIVKKLLAGADVMVENFRPGAMDKLGFGAEELMALNPRLIYCSEKGFLTGPYEHRTALDEVAQMMGGLAYMTGPTGRPLRAGASVIDVTGGMFGVIGILAALEERHRTGKGRKVTASLFETTVYLVGQHMAQYAVTGEEARPMPERISAWAVYDVFDVKDGEKCFVGVVSDGQWRNFCAAFELDDWLNDEVLAKNNGRVAARETIMPRLKALFATFSKAELMEKLEQTGLPFAPIARPAEHFTDPHLNAGGGLVEVTIPSNGKTAKLPALPIELDGERLALQRDVPKEAEHSREILAEAGLSGAEIEQLITAGTVRAL